MAKYRGKVGFGEQVKTKPGVYEDVITERTYSGDVVRAARQTDTGEGINSGYSLNNSISLVADNYALTHLFAIRYIEWAGVLWNVTSVSVEERPRLLVRMGGVYNGPTA